MSIIGKTNVGLKRAVTIRWMRGKDDCVEMHTYIKTIDILDPTTLVPIRRDEDPDILCAAKSSLRNFVINVVRTSDMDPWIEVSDLYLKLKVKFSVKQITSKGIMDLPDDEYEEIGLGAALEMYDMRIISIRENTIKIFVGSVTQVYSRDYKKKWYE